MKKNQNPRLQLIYSTDQIHCQHLGKLTECKDFRKTRMVGIHPVNSRGIFDVLGNIWEWCWDEWMDNDKSQHVNPHSDQNLLAKRIVKGGSWATASKLIDPKYREYRSPEERTVSVGLRLVRQLE